jgi:HD superfamily phosphodiesterase
MMAMATSTTIIATTFLDNTNNKNIGRKRGGRRGKQKAPCDKIKSILRLFLNLFFTLWEQQGPFEVQLFIHEKSIKNHKNKKTKNKLRTPPSPLE